MQFESRSSKFENTFIYIAKNNRSSPKTELLALQITLKQFLEMTQMCLNKSTSLTRTTPKKMFLKMTEYLTKNASKNYEKTAEEDGPLRL